MGMFDQAKNLYQLQRQAKEIKKELSNIHIEAEVDGVIVIINGEQEVISVTIPEEANNNPNKLGENLVKAFNKAIKKSQQIAAEKMKGVMGDLGLPGAGA
jgi:DNA-binding protein YbaB